MSAAANGAGAADAAGAPHAVAVVIPAKDEGSRIAATVASAQRIPGADLILVVDDGSSDDTGVRAREAGRRSSLIARTRARPRR